MRGKYHMGFYSIRDIAAGEELFYDYGDRDPEHPWLQTVIIDGKPEIPGAKVSQKKTAPQSSTLSEVSQAPRPSVAKGSHTSPRKGKGKAAEPVRKAAEPVLKHLKHPQKRRSTPKNRYSRMCPIGGCRSEFIALVKISQHIREIHPEVSTTERRNLCDAAEIVQAGTIARAHLPPSAKQKTLLSFLSPTPDRFGGTNSSPEKAPHHAHSPDYSSEDDAPSKRAKGPNPKKPP